MKEAILHPLMALGSSGSAALPRLDSTEERVKPVLEFEPLFREHGEFVLRTVRRMGVPAPEVEDVAQNVFLVVHRHLRSYEGRGTVKAWLFGIVRRAVADHRRQKRRRPEVPVLEPPVGVLEPETEAQLDRARQRALLDKALDALDESKREVFVLFELEQMSMTEVAAAVDCPLQTAYSRLYSARERVKEVVLTASKGGRRG